MKPPKIYCNFKLLLTQPCVFGISPSYRVCYYSQTLTVRAVPLNFMIRSLSSEGFTYSVSKPRGSENGKVIVLGGCTINVQKFR